MFPNSVETLVARAVAVISCSPGLPPTYTAETITWGTESALSIRSECFFVSPILANNTITARTVAVISHVPGLGPTYDPIDIDWMAGTRGSLVAASYHAFAPIINAAVSIAINPVGSVLTVDAYVASAISSLQIRSNGEVYVQGRRGAWVKWSDIGNLDFTIDNSNIAGERPLGLNGSVYKVQMLGDKIMAYCQNGVVAMLPAGSGFGTVIVYRAGVLSKTAVADGVGVHFFIDDQDRLVEIDKKGRASVLGFSEYLSGVTTPVLFCDPRYSLLYISGSNEGYLYNYETKSFTGGLAGITGFGFDSGSEYVASSGTVTVPDLEIVTDVFDLGDRHHKTIFGLEIGSDTDVLLEAQVYYRRHAGDSFSQTAWKEFNNYGRVNLTAMGVEFKIAIKTTESSSFGLDYLTVFGRRHRH